MSVITYLFVSDVAQVQDGVDQAEDTQVRRVSGDRALLLKVYVVRGHGD